MHTRKVKEYKSLNTDISNKDEDGNKNNNSITILYRKISDKTYLIYFIFFKKFIFQKLFYPLAKFHEN